MKMMELKVKVLKDLMMKAQLKKESWLVAKAKP
jgi:hypothetical protein